jgi:hypothetical protein
MIEQWSTDRHVTRRGVKLGAAAKGLSTDGNDMVQGLKSRRASRPARQRIGSNCQVFVDEKTRKGLTDPTAGRDNRFTDKQSTKKAAKKKQ